MPTNCNFYILSDAREDGRFLFSCALIEKLYGKKHQVYVHCQHQEEAHRFSQLLWSYKETSFIPHGLIGEYSSEDSPIQIGFNQEVPKGDIILFLSVEPLIPDFVDQFKRVVEIVTPDPLIKKTLRERYQQYRDRGHEIKTYPV